MIPHDLAVFVFGVVVGVVLVFLLMIFQMEWTVSFRKLRKDRP